MGQSNYFLDWILKSTLVGPSAAPVFMSLHNSDPGAEGMGELRGHGYGRHTIIFQRAAPGVASNTETVEFADLPEAKVGYFGLWDAVAGGHYLIGGELLATQQGESGQALRWRAAELIISIG